MARNSEDQWRTLIICVYSHNLGWVCRGIGDNPPRRCATAVAPVKASQAFTPSDGGDFHSEFFMPRCGATFDKMCVPPWTRGDFRGVQEWVVRSAVQPDHDNPLKASRVFTTAVVSPSFPLWVRGIFRGQGPLSSGQLRNSGIAATRAPEKILSEETGSQASCSIPGAPQLAACHRDLQNS